MDPTVDAKSKSGPNFISSTAAKGSRSGSKPDSIASSPSASASASVSAMASNESKLRRQQLQQQVKRTQLLYLSFPFLSSFRIRDLKFLPPPLISQ